MTSTIRSLVFVAAGALMFGCVGDPGAIECATGIICPSGTSCAAVQQVCIVNNCGNGLVDTGEACDDGNIMEGDGCSSSCKAEGCGNNLVDPGEICDDGNTIDGEGNCAANCLSDETCGNGSKNFGEACDDSNNDSGDGCSADCKSTEICGNDITDVGELCDDGGAAGGCNDDCLGGTGCGDGSIDKDANGNPIEQCDDGNSTDTDDCHDCFLSTCGDGIVQATGAHLEQCDAGSNNTATESATCNLDCTTRACGDGKVNQTAGETCDDGDTIDSLGCDGDCTAPTCGDGRVNGAPTGGGPLEQCDPGTVGSDVTACDSDCTVPVCGDLHVNQTFTPTGGTVPEGCDDGGIIPGDGCSALCQIESCGNGVTETVNGEDCDDANTNDFDACRNNCQAPACGDGIKSASEICDTNGNSATCDFDCTLPLCGDTVINGSFTPPTGTAPESCDDGGTTAGDGCSAVCRIETCGNGITEGVNGEQCDDANLDDLDACRNNCQSPACGDGIKSTSEICDTNGDTMSCDNDCTLPVCNDGVTNLAAGEQCEDGNLTNGDGCSSTCRLEPFALTVTLAGNGIGLVTSNPAGINCGADCSELYLSGTIVTLTATPSSNATFAGFSGACTGATCVVTMNAVKNVTATFAANRLTVTRSGTGAGTVTGTGIACGADCTEDYNVGTIVTLTATPAAGSVFAGWSGGGCSGTGTCPVTMNTATTVNATFTLDLFTLTVTPNGNGTGTVNSVPTGIDCGLDCTEAYDNGTVVTLFAAAAGNSTFTGWSGSGCSGTGTCVVTMSAARSVTATFTLRRFTLTVTKNGSGTVTSVPSGINCGADCTEDYNAGTPVQLTAVPNAKQVFTGWSGACSGTGTCDVIMDANTTVTATFELNRLTVVRSGDGNGTVTSNPAGISCGGNCTEDYDAATSVTLTAVASGGSRFVGWSGGGCSGTGTCVVLMNGATTVTANFADLDTLTVSRTGGGTGTVTSNPAGINCGGDCTEEYLDGTLVTLTATATGGSIFTGWSGVSCPGTGTCQVTLTANTTVTATFELARTLTVARAGLGTGTVTSNPAGISCGADCTEDYINNTVVTLTAGAAVGSIFTGWSDVGCPGTGTCVVTMNAAKTVTATFALLHTLTVSRAGAGTGTVTSSPVGITCGADCTEDFVAGTVVTLTALADAGSTFTGWSAASCPGTAPCDVTMDAAKAITATFTSP